MEQLPTFADVQEAARRLEGHAARTPLLRSDALDSRFEQHLFFKPECNQHVGAFKYRGARNRLAALSEPQQDRGVVAFSSGNHAQGVARAARELGIDAVIVMPRDAPAVKVAGVEADGATIVTYDRITESREEIAAAIAERDGRTLVPSFDDLHIIAGQGTVGLEMVEQARDQGIELDAVITCIGGGGLCAGIALSLAELSPGTDLFGAEPSGYNDHQLSLRSSHRIHLASSPPTLCDALMTPQPGEITWAINRGHLKDVFDVTDAACLATMKVAWKELGVKLEPGGAVAMAAVLRGDLKSYRNVGVVLSGGNVDPDVWDRAIA